MTIPKSIILPKKRAFLVLGTLLRSDAAAKMGSSTPLVQKAEFLCLESELVAEVGVGDVDKPLCACRDIDPT